AETGRRDSYVEVSIRQNLICSNTIFLRPRGILADDSGASLTLRGEGVGGEGSMLGPTQGKGAAPATGDCARVTSHPKQKRRPGSFLPLRRLLFVQHMRDDPQVSDEAIEFAMS